MRSLQSKKRSIFPKLLAAFFFMIIVIGDIYGLKYIPKVEAPGLLVSPINTLSKLSMGANIWLPQTQVLASEDQQISAKAAFFIDADSGKVLYEQNAHQRLPIASLTKIM